MAHDIFSGVFKELLNSPFLVVYRNIAHTSSNIVVANTTYHFDFVEHESKWIRHFMGKMYVLAQTKMPRCETVKGKPERKREKERKTHRGKARANIEG